MTDLSWAYTGMERFDLIAIRNLVIKIAGTLIIFYICKEGNRFSVIYSYSARSTVD